MKKIVDFFCQIWQHPLFKVHRCRLHRWWCHNLDNEAGTSPSPTTCCLCWQSWALSFSRNFFDTISYFQVQGLSGKEAEIVRLVCVTSILGKLPTACRLSFVQFSRKNIYVAKNSFTLVSLSIHFKKNRWKPAQTILHGLTTRVNSGLKLLETRSQKGTAGFTYAGFAWNFKIVKSYPLFAATGAEWHFLCPGGKCPGRSTQEGSLPHRTHVGKRRVILNDSWCPKYNCTKRGIAPFSFQWPR